MSPYHLPALELKAQLEDNIRQAIPTDSRTRVAAAGGINSANAGSYARSAADLPVTSAPYFAPPRDVAVTLTAA